RLDPAHELVDLVGLCERRQWPESTRQIFVSRRRNAERAKPIVSREVQVLEQRQTRRLVDEANHALAPTVGPRVVDGTRGRAFRGRQEFLIDERQVLAEREAALDPIVGVTQRYALPRTNEIELADQH